MKEAVCGCFPTGRHYPGIAHLLRTQSRGTLPEFEAEQPWAKLPIVMIDTETTGTDAQKDRIVEIGLVRVVDGAIVERRNWLINPEIPIPDEARQVHGISNEDVANAPTFRQIAAELAEALRGAIPAAYNAGFDRNFVSSELARSGLPFEQLPACVRPECDWIDPLVWARELQKYEKGKKLGEVAGRLGITIENAHRASDDAEAAMQVLLAFAADPRMPAPYGALLAEQRRLAKVQEDDMRAWRKRQPGS